MLPVNSLRAWKNILISHLATIRSRTKSHANIKCFLTCEVGSAENAPIRRSIFNCVTSNDVVHRDGERIRRPNRNVW